VAINPTFGLIILAVTPSGFTGHWSSQDKVKPLLEQVLKSQRSVDYVRLETRIFGNGGSAEVKVQTVAGKGIMVTIRKPVERAGIVTIDDTKVSKTYFPDQDEVWIQPSPYLLQPAFALRWKLINQNYTLKEGRASTIAGQRVRQIVLEPIDNEIPTRRMFVDPKHKVMLRYVMALGHDDESVVFDTKSVEFGRVAAMASFGLPSISDSATIKNFEGPRPVFIPADSKEDAKFSARLPDDLPFGFEISGAYLFGKGVNTYVAVKLTDGMSTLTVYEWLKRRAKSPPDAKHTETDRYGVSFGIAVVPGDTIPNSVLEQIVQAFLEGAE